MAGFLGCHQLGVELPLSLQCVDGDGVPDVPGAAPVVAVFGPSGTLVFRKPMAADQQGVVDGLFRLPEMLDDRFVDAGLYAVAYSWVDSGGAVRGRAAAFLLRQSIPTGADGAVVGLRPLLTPAATFLLRQTDAGLYAAGRNPR